MNAPTFCVPIPLPSHSTTPALNASRCPRSTTAPSLSARRPRPPPAPQPQPPNSSSKRPRQTHPRNAPSNPSLSQSEYSRILQLSTRPDKRVTRAAIRAALQAHPQDMRLWLLCAQFEARCSNFAAARRAFEQAVQQDASNIRILHAWAVMEDRAGSSTRARTLFQRCLDLDPSDGIVWQSLALMEERCGMTSDARRTFEEGVRHDPDNAFLWSAWGVLEQRHGRHQRACHLFEHAIQLDDQHVRTYQAYAITKERMGKHQRAQQLFRHALRVNPLSVPTYQAYALFAARRGQLDLARELFTKGSQIDPLHAPIWHAWAVMEQKERRYDVARELFQNGVNAAPDNTPMLRAWAAMELQLGHIDKSHRWMVPPRKNARRMRREKDSRKASQKQISVVGENLKMLRLMIGQRSDEDVKTVMKWMDGRAKTDRQLYDVLQKRPGDDMRKVSEWVARRSASDIKSFKEWLADRYEQDRRIGVYIFNWDIAPRSSTSVRVPVPVTEQQGGLEKEKPIEWLMLSEDSAKAMLRFDDQMYYSDSPTEYADVIHFMGQIAEGLVDRAALLFVLGAMSVGLAVASVSLYEDGYSPSGNTVHTEVDRANMPPPSGVDAHLYDMGGAESAVQQSVQKARVK